MARQPLRLDDQLCFALYEASMTVGRLYKPRLDALGITYPQYLALNALWERDGITVGEIADRLRLDPSTVTPLVKRLAASGLVRRDRNPDDERKVVVRLTSRGQDLRAPSACLGDDLVAAAGRPVEELRNLARELHALRGQLEDAAARAVTGGRDARTPAPRRKAKLPSSPPRP